MKKYMTDKEIETMLDNFDPEEAYTRQSAARRKILNDPANAEFLKECRERRAIAEALYKARTEANLTQAEVAARMNVSQPYIVKLERGRSSISWKVISRYAEACGKKVAITIV
ncbi:helix-turn-helix transcriptional regulator [bacterium]|nr:helix-turn-helix transcriptional regulator [bacterium]